MYLFIQAADVIVHSPVSGVRTCALPIFNKNNYLFSGELSPEGGRGGDGPGKGSRGGPGDGNGHKN